MSNWKKFNENHWDEAKNKVKTQQKREQDGFGLQDWSLVNHTYQSMSKAEGTVEEPEMPSSHSDDPGYTAGPNFPRTQKTKFDPATETKGYTPQQKQIFAHYTTNKAYTPLEAHGLITGDDKLHRFEEENPSRSFLKDVQSHVSLHNKVYHANKHVTNDRGAINPQLNASGHRFLANQKAIDEVASTADKFKDMTPRERSLAALKARREAFDKDHDKIVAAHGAGVNSKKRNVSQALYNHNAVTSGGEFGTSDAGPTKGDIPSSEAGRSFAEQSGRKVDPLSHMRTGGSFEEGDTRASSGYQVGQASPHAAIAAAPGMIERSQKIIQKKTGKTNVEELLDAEKNKPVVDEQEAGIPENTRKMLHVYASHHADIIGRALESAQRRNYDVDYDAALKFLGAALQGYHKRPAVSSGDSRFDSYLATTLHHGLPSEHKMMTPHGKHIEDMKIDANKLLRESQSGNVKSLEGKELEAAKQKSVQAHQEKAQAEAAKRGQDFTPQTQKPPAVEETQKPPAVEETKKPKNGVPEVETTEGEAPKTKVETPEDELKRLMGEQQQDSQEDTARDVPAHMTDRIGRAKKMKMTPEQMKRMLDLEEGEKLGRLDYESKEDEGEDEGGDEPSYDPRSDRGY